MWVLSKSSLKQTFFLNQEQMCLKGLGDWINLVNMKILKVKLMAFELDKIISKH